MSTIEQRPQPASVSVSKDTNSQIAKLAGAITDIWTGLQAVAEKVGAELPDSEAVDWARRRAAAPSRQAAIDATLLQISETRSAARRQTGLPEARRDGTRARMPDPERAALERQAALDPRSQAVRHQEMASAARCSDGSDPRPWSREIREQMYERMRKEAE